MITTRSSAAASSAATIATSHNDHAVATNNTANARRSSRRVLQQQQQQQHSAVAAAAVTAAATSVKNGASLLNRASHTTPIWPWSSSSSSSPSMTWAAAATSSRMGLRSKVDQTLGSAVPLPARKTAAAAAAGGGAVAATTIIMTGALRSTSPARMRPSKKPRYCPPTPPASSRTRNRQQQYFTSATIAAAGKNNRDEEHDGARKKEAQAVKRSAIAACTKTEKKANTALPDSWKPTLTSLAASEFSCALCLDVLVQATTLVPCGHAFCASCIQDHGVRESGCPTCRAKVTATAPCRSLNHIISTFMNMPEQQQQQQQASAQQASANANDESTFAMFSVDDQQVYQQRMMATGAATAAILPTLTFPSRAAHVAATSTMGSGGGSLIPTRPREMHQPTPRHRYPRHTGTTASAAASGEVPPVHKDAQVIVID